MSFGVNPESAAINSIDNQKRSEDIKNTADKLLPYHEKIAPTLEKMSIDPDDFADLYDKDVIAKDKEYVERLKQDFQKTALEPMPGAAGLTRGDVKKLSEISEFQVFRGINLGDWFNYCKIIKTSEFDDYAKGFDGALEFVHPKMSGHLGIGIDVSFSHKKKKKFQRAKDEIDNFDGKENVMGTIRYFKSPRSGITGRLTNLPRVVTAMDIGVIEDMVKLKKLDDHIFRYAMIREVEEQLEVMSEYAGDTGSKAYDTLKRNHHFFEMLSEGLDAEETLKRSEYRKNKDAEAAIKRGLAKFR